MRLSIAWRLPVPTPQARPDAPPPSVVWWGVRPPLARRSTTTVLNHRRTKLNKEHAASLLRRYTIVHTVVRLSQKSCVFMSMQPVFIDLAHCPTSGCLEVSYACQLFNL